MSYYDDMSCYHTLTCHDIQWEWCWQWYATFSHVMTINETVLVTSGHSLVKTKLNQVRQNYDHYNHWNHNHEFFTTYMYDHHLHVWSFHDHNYMIEISKHVMTLNETVLVTDISGHSLVKTKLNQVRPNYDHYNHWKHNHEFFTTYMYDQCMIISWP